MMSTEVIDQDLVVRCEHDQRLVESRLRSGLLVDMDFFDSSDRYLQLAQHLASKTAPDEEVAVQAWR